MPARALLIGLDGATFDLIDPWIAEGRLPAVAGLIASGVRARLESTIPPVTFPAWSSILTGMSPAQHGLTDFTIPEPDGRLRFASAQDRAAPTLFRLVSDAGGRVAAIGFPTTYPPERLNGIAVGGFDSPVARGLAAGAIFPPDALRDAEAACGPYLTTDVDETAKGRNWHRRALERLLLTVRRRADIVAHLLRRERWDLLAVHFGQADTAGHHFWAVCDPRSPRHVPALFARFGNALRLVYEALDRAVGELAQAAGGDATVFVVSDHGMGGTSDRVIFLNRWLERCGLCALNGPSMRGRALGTLRTAGFTLLPARLQSAVFRRVRSLAGWLEARARLDPIDLAHTRAWSEELPYFPSVRLNVAASEREAAAREVSDALLALRDPVDGGPVFRAVLRREAIARGPFADRYPALIGVPRLPEGYAYHFGRTRPGTRDWFERLPPAEYLGAKGRSMNGSHRPEGVLILAGPGIGAGRGLAGARVQDAAPTLLHLLGLPVPEAMEGRVLAEALIEPAAARAIRRGPEAALPKPGTVGDMSERDAEVARRLRSLGYL